MEEPCVVLHVKVVKEKKKKFLLIKQKVSKIIYKNF